jgi:putative transposase
LQNWVRSYREAGLSGLAKKGRSDRGKPRGLPEELVLLIEGLALQAVRRPLTCIHELVSQVADEQHWPTPSYAQVYRIVQHLPKDLLTLGQEGAAAYRETFDLLFRREAKCANAIWQADHCQLRIYLKDEQGKAQMPLLTAIEDDYSRCLAGYRLAWGAPSAAQTALALRGAIGVKSDPRWPIHGVPGCFYTDHGSDFTSKHMEAVAVDLKMPLIFSQVGRPRGRGKVERFFRTVREEVLAKLPGYAPKVKDDIRRQREIEAQAREQPLLSLSEFEAIFRIWLLDTYHTRVHTETEAAPRERWLDSGVIPVLPGNETQLDLLLFQPRRHRIVHQEGITLLSAWYMHPLLAGHVGDAVIIRYDPMDLAEMWVYEAEQEEHFICRAQCVERGGQAVSLQEIAAERTKRRKEVGKALRERKRVVARYASPEQQAERALDTVSAVSVEDLQAQEAGTTSEARRVRPLPAARRQIRWYDDE